MRYGAFVLPLFEGNPTELINEVYTDGEWRVDDLITRKILKFAKFSSIEIKLCDSRQVDELDSGNSLVRKEFLGEFGGKFKFGPLNSQPASSLKAKKQDLQEFEASMMNAFVEATGLAYVP